MSREKQIEEMAKDMCACCREAVTNNECELGGCDGVRQHAEALYNSGYRRASDVAEEIFAELKTKAPFFCENQIAYDHFNEELGELKKKYTEDGE